MSQSSLHIVSVLSSVFRGLRSGAGFSPSGRPIQDHLQLITLLRACSCSVVWGGVHDRSQRVSQRCVAGRLPFRADPETIHRSVVQPVTRLVAWSSQSRSATARSPRSSSRIRSRNRYGWPVRSVIRRRRHPPKQPQQLPGSAARTHPPTRQSQLRRLTTSGRGMSSQGRFRHAVICPLGAHRARAIR